MKRIRSAASAMLPADHHHSHLGADHYQANHNMFELAVSPFFAHMTDLSRHNRTVMCSTPGDECGPRSTATSVANLHCAAMGRGSGRGPSGVARPCTACDQR